MDTAQQIGKLLESDLSKLKEQDRLALLHASYRLSDAVEQPFEKVFRQIFSIYDPIVLRVAADLGLFDIALAKGGTVTIQELAEASNADAEFVQRIVRVLVPLGFMTAKDDGQYSLTPLAPALAEGSPLKEGLIHITHLYPAISRMPEYFAANKYHNPRDALDAPFNLAFNYKGKTLFDFYAQPENARYAKAFNVTMEMQKGRSDDAFVESYPANERLANNDSQRVLFVDVGGGLGHQIRKFQNSYPSLQGQYILEDLPEVVEKATDLPPSTTKVGHNFFQPQPDAVNNAKAFYLRTILHDWPNQQAAAILKHIVDAMAKDSVVLVHDIIMPEAGVGLMDAKMDIHMMTLGALERTEKQWTALADSVGLKINGFWKEKAGDIGTRGLIEMAKK